MENPDHVTRNELAAKIDAVESKIDSLHNRFLLYLGIAVGLINFNLPTPVTVGAIGAMVGKAAWVLVFRA